MYPLPTSTTPKDKTCALFLAFCSLPTMYCPILVPLIQHVPNIVHEDKNHPLILTELKKQPKPKNKQPPQPERGTRHHSHTHPHKTKQQRADRQPAIHWQNGKK